MSCLAKIKDYIKLQLRRAVLGYLSLEEFENKFNNNKISAHQLVLT
jgi:hypothetical protein